MRVRRVLAMDDAAARSSALAAITEALGAKLAHLRECGETIDPEALLARADAIAAAEGVSFQAAQVDTDRPRCVLAAVKRVL